LIFTFLAVKERGDMSKHIIFCADGTWNSPNCDDNKDNVPDPSNVYRLFRNLQELFPWMEMKPRNGN